MGIEHFRELFVELMVVGANDKGIFIVTVASGSNNGAAKVMHGSESPLIDQPQCAADGRESPHVH